MNKILLVILISLSAITSASANELCRSLIVDTYDMFGVKINPMSFSSAQFEDLNIKVEDFNVMSSEEQQVIYDLVKPMSTSVIDTISAISSVINRYKGTEFEITYANQLQVLRVFRDQLRVCAN